MVWYEDGYNLISYSRHNFNMAWILSFELRTLESQWYNRLGFTWAVSKAKTDLWGKGRVSELPHEAIFYAYDACRSKANETEICTEWLGV